MSDSISSRSTSLPHTQSNVPAQKSNVPQRVVLSQPSPLPGVQRARSASQAQKPLDLQSQAIEINQIIDQANPLAAASTASSFDGLGITPSALLKAKSALKPVSQRQVLSVGQDKTVVESGRSVTLAQGGTNFGIGIELKPGGRLDIVGHGSPDGKTLGGKTAQQLAMQIKASGVTQLAVLDLKSCHSSVFKAELQHHLNQAGIQVDQIKTYHGAIAVSRKTGEVLQGRDAVQNPANAHDGALGSHQVFVQTLTGKTITLDIDDADTNDMKLAKLQDKEGIPVGPERRRAVLQAINAQLPPLRQPYALENLFTTTEDIRTFDDVPFENAEQSLDIVSYVQVEGDHVKVSREFSKSLATLVQLDPNDEILQGVAKELRMLENGEKADFPNLKTFIEYQVYKTGAHEYTHDEVKWANKLAEEKASQEIYASRGVTKELLVPELMKHYMCECRYSQPSDTLMRRDLPDFVNTRLKVADQEKIHHLFQTSNGCSISYDPKQISLKDVQAVYQEELSGFGQGAKIEFVPFDSEQFMIAKVQVPVMSAPLTIQVQTAEHGLVDVIMGDGPEDVGYEMTDEPAGVFKRSFNSQRVVEIVGKDRAGQDVSFQLKGSGVPEYGFRKENMTGGEFFKLTVEKSAMGLRDFATTIFDNPAISPNMGGMALAMKPENAFSGGTRKGAVSFRLDYSKGIRAANILPTQGHSGSKTESPELYTQMLAKTGVKDIESYKTDLMQKVANNLAQTHLFGMNYDDSSLSTLEDLGLHGEFSDSGSLRNLLPNTPINIEYTTLYLGLRQRLGGKIAVQFQETYVKAVFDALKHIGDKSERSQEMATLLDTVMDKIGTNKNPNKSKWESDIHVDKLAQFISEFTASLGDQLNKTPEVQQVFYAKGVDGYAKILIDKLNAKVDTLM